LRGVDGDASQRTQPKRKKHYDRYRFDEMEFGVHGILLRLWITKKPHCRSIDNMAALRGVNFPADFLDYILITNTMREI
jgi:hypothetical protein